MTKETERKIRPSPVFIHNTNIERGQGGGRYNVRVYPETKKKNKKNKGGEKISPHHVAAPSCLNIFLQPACLPKNQKEIFRSNKKRHPMPGVLTDDASQIMLLLRGVVVSWLCVCDMYSSSRHPVVIIMTRKSEQEIRLQDCGLGVAGPEKVVSGKRNRCDGSARATKKRRVGCRDMS